MERGSLDLERIRALYMRGCYQQALAASEGLPFEEWPGTAGRIPAGRVAGMLGASRLATAIHLRAWRQDRDDGEALCYHVHALNRRRGPLRAWQVLRRAGLEGGSDRVRAELHALEAGLLASFRDFGMAHRALDRAIELQPDSPWVAVEQAFVLEREDRYRDALDAARRAIDVRAWYGPAVQQVGHLLQLLDREEEAVAVFSGALEHTENGLIAGQLAALHMELHRPADALAALDRAEALLPLRDKSTSLWLGALRADAAYQAGDVELAVTIARELESPFHRALAERIEGKGDGAEPGRVQLDVPFLRQGHMTCGPATLTSLARFFDRPADQLSVADQICYGGTTDDSQRRWAEGNGFTTREFTLNEADAVALLDRGIPFGLSTVEVTSAHMQSVIGYDLRRGVFLLRDPYHRNVGEMAIEAALIRYAPTGPRALVLVPVERRELLDGLELRDASAYDAQYAMQGALRAHDHAAACAAYRVLAEREPEHRVTILSRLALCAYERDQVGVLVCLDRLLERFPDDDGLWHKKLRLLQDLGRRQERLEFLEQRAAQPGADPAFAEQLAGELLADARLAGRADSLLRRVIARRPDGASAYATRADLLWGRGDFDDAIAHYRIASCLAETDERLAMTYFRACVARGRSDEALELLRARCASTRTRSAAPARSLFAALDQIDRTHEGFAALDEAIAARADDAELLLFAADQRARYGDYERADAILERAAAAGSEVDEWRTRARIASYRGHAAEALRQWQRVVEREPLDEGAHAEIARQLELTESRERALESLRDVASHYPFHRPLRRLLVEWLGHENAAEAERELRRLLDDDPSDAWAVRERALRLVDLGAIEEAIEVIGHGCALEPQLPQGHGIRGAILLAAGRAGEARDAFRAALERSIDYAYAMDALLATAGTDDERAVDLAFVREQLERQATAGEGLLCYWRVARQSVAPDAMVAFLEDLSRSRPDLWASAAVLVDELIAQERTAEAVAWAERAVAQFPLLPRLWQGLAQARHASGDEDGEIDALERALQINPRWGAALRQLAEAHRRRDDLATARHLLERAVGYDPLDPQNHGGLAEIQIELDEADAAVEHLQRALMIRPDYAWAMAQLRSVAEILGTPELPVETVRRMVRERPKNASAWIQLAEILGPDGDLGERVEALNTAISLEPTNPDPYDGLADALSAQGRFDDAEAACRRFPNEGVLPVSLRGRLAWILACRGRHDAAIEALRAVVADDASYHWGWNRLADLLADQGRAAEYREAAEAMVRIAPEHAASWGYLGDACRACRAPAEARRAMERALELEGSYAYAAEGLFLLDLEAEDHDGAAGHLEVLDRTGAATAHWRGAVLAARTGDTEAAATRLESLCRRLDVAGAWIHDAVAQMREAEMGDTVAAVFGRVVEADTVHAEVGAAWTMPLVADRNWVGCRELLDRMAPRGGLRQSALIAIVGGMVEAKAWRAFRALFEAEAATARAGAHAWGTVGWALLAEGRAKDAAAWMADWQTRAGVESWMLLTLSAALRNLGRDAEGHEVSARAVGLPVDHGTGAHHVLLAVDALAAGDLAAVERHLAGAEGDLDAFYVFLREVLGATLAYLQSADAAPGWAGVTDRLRTLRRAETGQLDLVQRRGYRLCVHAVVRHRGGLRAWLWGLSSAR